MKQWIVAVLDSTWITNLYSYLYENIACLTFGIQMIPDESAYFGAFFALIKDISEGYGAWTAFVVLFLSVFTTVMIIQQLIEYGVRRLIVWKRGKNKSNQLNNDTFFGKKKITKYLK